MSARDDLVAAMEAHEAWMNSTSDKYAEWDKCVAGALTVIRKHGPYFKALLDAEPVAWRVEWEEHHPYGSTTATQTFVDFYDTLDDVPENLRRNATALYARPEASDE